IKKSGKEDLDRVIYLLEGRVFPQYDERKIGMSSRLILKVISKVTGVDANEVEKEWKKKGDLGIVVEELIKKKKQRTLFSKEKLSVKKVFENISKLASLEGKGTVSRKIDLVAELLTSANPEEAKYIVRTVLEDLRVGVAEGVLRDGIGKAYERDVKEVERAFDTLMDYGEVAKKAKENKLGKIGLEVGRPLRVMLAIKVEDIKEAFKAVGKPALFEQKLDGFRVQIHKKGKEIRLFTRSMENVTNQFKEVLDLANKNIKCESCIIDTEFVGYDKKTNRYLPFQKISQRIKRKYNIERIAKEYPVEINVFDILSYNGKDMIDEEQERRRKLIEEIIKEEKRKIVLTKKLVTDDEKEALNFFDESLKQGNEGLIVKKLDANYQPGRRVSGWVKLKTTLEPLDLVIIGAEWGTGKRVGMLSSFVLGCRKEKQFLECGMMGTGIKEKTKGGVSFKQLTKLLKPLIIDEKGRKVKLKAKVIVEVSYEEIQKSPTYSSGFALRFPRLNRLRSAEKGLNDVNTIKDIERLYKGQRK
ncbi:MAG: ATP-dependent DNA ligase, partial [Nanoarchaeota archaeon]